YEALFRALSVHFGGWPERHGGAGPAWRAGGIPLSQPAAFGAAGGLGRHECLGPQLGPYAAVWQPGAAECRHGPHGGPQLRGLRGQHQAKHGRLRLQHGEARALRAGL
nr:hypothetical protein [Tanacetum cinerariifolium]